jgi:hypothetical protein
MECLARNSSILKIQAGNVQGLVYIKDGQIIHAQCGERTGEEAFNYLLGLAGGEFDVVTFADPPNRSITGSWEFLLMEAARKRDETGPLAPGQSDSGFSTAPHTQGERTTPNVVPVIEAGQAPSPNLRPESQACLPPGTRPNIEEFLVCSLQGEVLHEWQCSNPNARVSFLEFLAQKARQLTQGLPLSDFDRLEVNGTEGRVIAQVQDDRALFIRTRPTPLEGSTNPVSP